MWNCHWDNRMDDLELKSVVLAAVTAEPEFFLDEIAWRLATWSAWCKA